MQLLHNLGQPRSLAPTWFSALTHHGPPPAAVRSGPAAGAPPPESGRVSLGLLQLRQLLREKSLIAVGGRGASFNIPAPRGNCSGTTAW